MKKLITLSLLAIPFLSAVPGSMAAILATENFGYTDGAIINGQSGGIGWGSPWVASDFPAPEDPRQSYASPVTYPGYASGGGYMTYRSDFRNATRALDTSGGGAFSAYLDGSNNIGLDGTQLWISVVNQRKTNFLSDGGEAFRLLLRRDGSDVLTTAQNDLDGDSHLYVLHIQFLAGADTVTTYFDPDLSIAPTGGIVSNLDASFDELRFDGFYFGGAEKPTVGVDGIIVAQSAADIGFVPEPNSIALLGLGVGALLFLRRRVSSKG